MKNVFKLLLLLSLSFMLVGCASNDDTTILEVVPNDDVNEKISYDADIEKNEDGSYTLILSGNPTTGYTWSIDKVVGSEFGEIVSAGEIEYISSVDNSKLPPEEKVMGAGGKFYLNITSCLDELDGFEEAKDNLTTSIVLRYSRPWESTLPLFMCEVKFTYDKNTKEFSYEITK